MKRLISLVLAILALTVVSSVAGAQEFMSVVELKQLLSRGPVRAQFKTVVDGSAISSYDIVIRGTADFGEQSVLVFTTWHFIAAGMSGSPVYVIGLDGRKKLLGAVAYFASPFAVGEQWGGISPIEYMHAEAVASQEPAIPGFLPATFMHNGVAFAPIALGDRVVPDVVLRHAEGSPDLERLLKATKMTITTRGSGGLSDGTLSRVLKPGSPLMVDLLEIVGGGMSTVVSATGTITYIGKDGEVYGFGHPFLGARAVRYNFRTCTIVGTVLSRYYSYKIAGERSVVLGTIKYDGSHGVYGKIGAGDQRVSGFSVDISTGGRPIGSYDVRMAISHLTSPIMALAFDVIGDIAKVPLDHQTSAAMMTASVELDGHRAIQFNQMFTSSRFVFGPAIYYRSSYRNGWEAFVEGVYVPLMASRFKFAIGKTRVGFDFTDGRAPSLRIANLAFPTKVQFGRDPVLEILLVSEDNKETLTLRMDVHLDWSAIVPPVYASNVEDTEKQSEKVVWGSISLATSDQFNALIADGGDRATEIPQYFLHAGDYIDHLEKSLARNNRALHCRVVARGRSVPGRVATAAQLERVPERIGVDHVDQTSTWVVGGGLTDRKIGSTEDKAVRFWVGIPSVPPGFVIATVYWSVRFEVVL